MKPNRAGAFGLLAVLLGGSGCAENRSQITKECSSMTTQDRERELLAAGLSREAVGALLPMGMTSARIEIEAGLKAGPDRSCLRGRLGLPEGWSFEPRGFPLAYVGCVVLAEVAPIIGAEGLPARGALRFYYDGFSSVRERQGTGWKVEYRPDPPFCEHPGGDRDCFPIRFVPEWTLPISWSARFRRLKLSIPDTEKYEDIVRKRCHEHHYRVGGLPDPLGKDVAESLDDHLKSQRLPRPERWVLLLQLDSEARLGIDQLDGRAYFLISADDLARRDFDKVVVVTQRT